MDVLNSDKLLLEDNLSELEISGSVDKSSISSTDRLKEMLGEAEKELSIIQPEIDGLEEILLRLQELKKTKQKLITLKLSIQSILNNYTGVKLNKIEVESDETITLYTKAKLNNFSTTPKMKPLAKHLPETLGAFYPDEAFEKASLVLKQKSSLNYELFRAIVLAGGCASTQAIKDFLLEHDIKLPASGETFETVPLTDISARVNYLIRKGLVLPAGRGFFRATVGWNDGNPQTDKNE